MNLVRCDRGHFYDGDKFAECPHCAPNEEDRDVTISIENEMKDTEKNTVWPVKNESLSLKDAVEAMKESVAEDDDDDMGKTVRFFDDENGLGSEPCVGWLVGINGATFGECFPLTSGKNFIGRAKDMDVVLQMDNKVSRNKHAILIYEPRSRMFIAQPGESKELFYLNDEVVLNNCQMKKNDILLVGDTKLMLIPCCDDKFCWEEIMDEK